MKEKAAVQTDQPKNRVKVSQREREEELRKRIKFHDEAPNPYGKTETPFVASDFQTNNRKVTPVVVNNGSNSNSNNSDETNNKKHHGGRSKFKLFVLVFLGWTLLLVALQYYFFTNRHQSQLFLVARWARRHMTSAKTMYSRLAPTTTTGSNKDSNGQASAPLLDMTKWRDKLPYKRSGGAHSSDLYRFTLEDLRHYRGTTDNGQLPVLLAIKKRVYDVSRGRQFYGPGGGYHFFAGRDGTRSFITGCFQESYQCTEKSSVIDDLSSEEREEIDNWVKFYDDKYEYIGNLVE